MKSFSLHYFAIFRTPCFDTMMREIRVEANFFRILNSNIKIHSNAFYDDFYTYTYLLFTLLTKWTLAFIQKKLVKDFVRWGIINIKMVWGAPWEDGWYAGSNILQFGCTEDTSNSICIFLWIMMPQLYLYSNQWRKYFASFLNINDG